ncbi:MAG: uracil-DNA glycosylase [Acidimicrobiia bacterium]
MTAFTDLANEIASCAACPRLVAWRTHAAEHAPKRFVDSEYWARPVPGFGDPRARIVCVGLAPGAHGANRTGRMFTGDRSGDFLFASLYRCGLANQPTSASRTDGLKLVDAYVTSAVRCAPPDNAPAVDERDRCQSFLVRELALLRRAQVFVALGGFAYAALWRVLGTWLELPKPRPRFGHGIEVVTDAGVILGCFHPSQQNTFTGRLTERMMDSVFLRACALRDE